jgi:putative salt-induced outer membrane protein YdiY
MCKNSLLFLLLLTCCIPAIGQNQTPPPPPKIYSGNFGAGLALTGGNTDTKTFNMSYEFARDPKTRNILKSQGLYLRSSNQGISIADLLRLGFRDDYVLSKRVSVYGALGYLRDPFKQISYLLNPQGGLGINVYTSDRATFALSGGAGGAWEKNPNIDVRTSGTINTGQSFTCKLSGTSKFVQNFTSLWKTNDFADALYHFDVSLVSSIVKRVDLKLEFMNDYKNVTPNPTVKSNDTAFVASFLFKY